jgi:CHAT domain-containing protein
LLRREVAARKAAPRSAVIIADPVFSGDDPRAGSAAGAPPARFPRLPFTRFEAAGIRSVLPNDAESLLDFDASKEAISGRGMKEFRMMHIASHAVLDAEHPELTAIVLSGINRQGGPVDGFLRLHEIYNMTLPMDLVVLSACQTGLGTELRGEGLNSLTRGFLYAGAARVIATLWRVDDAATAELMKRFYQGLYGAYTVPRRSVPRPRCGRRRYMWPARSGGRIRSSGPVSSCTGSGADGRSRRQSGPQDFRR